MYDHHEKINVCLLLHDITKPSERSPKLVIKLVFLK